MTRNKQRINLLLGLQTWLEERIMEAHAKSQYGYEYWQGARATAEVALEIMRNGLARIDE